MRDLVVIVALLACAACGPKYVRGSEDKTIDNPAMSTGLDKRDLEQLLDQSMASMMESAVVKGWPSLPEPPVVAIFPIANETSEHVGGQLKALLSKIETRLVNGGYAQVVSQETQDALIEQIQKQQGGAFDKSRAAQVGKQLGARFYVTGKVYDAAERTSDARRVQYFLTMQILDVETGTIRWQNEAELTKALVR
ncbi:MAG: hypothetical protein AMXMBFR64_56340 [Myxococcales bacterium]